ncbi:MAG: DUF4091 domain-containing protein [Verrucomicrobiaceae bacterium]|nr:DUF4091 domain-containing protein [Verrucomicrobiaceae bacterium]
MRLLGIILACSLATQLAAKPALWLADGMTRVARVEEAPEPRELTLHAARGEWEPLQAVLSATAPQLTRINVDAVTLTHESGVTLPSPQIFHEHYVRVTTSSPMAPLPPGEYPDALLPLDMPADPPSGEGNLNQPFWIDIFVPYGSPAGDYNGRVSFTLADDTTLTASFKFHVWNFDLPVVPRLRTSMMTTPRRVSQVHGIAYDGARISLEHAQLLNQYYDLLAENRLSIDQVHGALPEPDGSLNEEKIERSLRRHLLHRHASTVSIPIWPDWPFKDPLEKDREAAMKHVATYAKILDKIHCAGRGYVIMGDLDEPSDADAYATVRRWGDFFNEVEKKHSVRVPLLITEQPTPEKTAWGSLHGSVDIWSVLFGYVWNDMEWAGGSHDIAFRRKQGDEIWAYAALVQMPDEWDKTHGNPHTLKHSHPPVWCTDFPPINHRIAPWLFLRHGITGFTYWDTLYYADDIDVWHEAGTFRVADDQIYNGDGLFIYPATKKNHGRDAPVASIRLKWLRESIDDYDYLMLARELGLDEQMRAIIETFARGFGDWDDNLPALLDARLQIARLIEKATQRRQTASTEKGGAP